MERPALEILGRAEGTVRAGEGADVHCHLCQLVTAYPHCYLFYLGLLCLRHQLLSWCVKVAEDGAWAHEIAALSSCLPVAAQISSLCLGLRSFRNGPRDQSGEVLVLGREGPALSSASCSRMSHLLPVAPAQ